MKVVKHKVDAEVMYLVPIGDLHIGDKGFSKEAEQKVIDYIDWIKKEKNAYTFLMGDILNTATRGSKTSPFEQSLTLDEQIEKAIAIFEPVAGKIIGIIEGNHELRIKDFCGYSPTSILAHRLNTPYCGHSAIVDFKVGSTGKGKTKVQYTGFFHHTTGGQGKTVGSKINKVADLKLLIGNADLYFGAHNHMLGMIPDTTMEYDSRHGKVVNRRQVLVDCGGYLTWNDSYAEAKMLPSLKLGSPRVRLNGVKRDIHVNI